MAFHYRKLLPKKPDPLGEHPHVLPKPCPKICVPPCPDDCNAVPQPPPPPPPPPPHADYNTSVVLVIVLCFLGFAFLIVSYVSIVRYRSSVRNTRRTTLHSFNDISGDDVIGEDHGQVLDHPIWYIRTIGLHQSVIDSVEVFKFKKGEGLVEGFDCSVCLSEFQEDENLRLLPKCSHAFHIHCIDTWLRSHRNCPLCRAPVVNDASVDRVTVEEGNFDGSGSEEGHQVENVSDLDVVGSDGEGGDGGNSEMRVNFIEDCTSLPIEDNDIDEICDKNFRFGPDRGNKVRGNTGMVEHRVTLHVEIEPVGRPFSMDCGSASSIYLAQDSKLLLKDEGSSSTKEDEGTSNIHMEIEMKQTSEMVPRPGNRNSSIYELVMSSSLGRSLQKVPLSMKKPFSSGGKSSLHTHIEDSS
ncbi:hypothetical protein LIER_12116 [Lithospermum erythrorhizon]|uniref:RING-type E3 ubiquitin transferase n=1 Tax=Lithospermum erythrorhizon TaxID=34254 RepID=A0AAV3PRU3_LITER